MSSKQDESSSSQWNGAKRCQPFLCFLSVVKFVKISILLLPCKASLFLLVIWKFPHLVYLPMAAFHFFFILFVVFISANNTHASEFSCTTANCDHGSPDVRFPFWLDGDQPEHYGCSAFKLVCKENSTVIRFPSYGDLIVKSISYEAREMDLLDPKNCVHGVFLNLDLSLSAFRYSYVVRNYTYLNCSARLPPPSMEEIPCLSGSGYHVYTVESSLAVVPYSCRAVKTVAIPFAYSPYISGNSFGLRLTWDLNSSGGPGCDYLELKRSPEKIPSSA